MLIGIFGSKEDPQCQRISSVLEGKGCSALLVEANAIGQGYDHSIDDDGIYYGDQRLDEIPAFYLRHVTSPMAPIVRMPEGQEPVLYRDWFTEYMHMREQQGMVISFLLALEERGAYMVNPPFAGSVNQYKPFQLSGLRHHGIPLPRTLVTNNPERVKRFVEEVGEVVFKPSMGGALCRRLDKGKLEELELIRKSPVIFQEFIKGEDVRVMMINGEAVSSVVVDSTTLDFREDPNYSSGAGTYREIDLPEDIVAMCARAQSLLGLRFAGIDLKYCGGDTYYFIEANSSPIYLDVELKHGHNITERIVDLLIQEAEKPPEKRPGPPSLKRHQDETLR
ncbi:MAG: ATP-grasp domain-containing protein [Planctomycetota bacterium]|nr:ATP-grasp domain-containing protein [Planctomycetota bacterium]MDA1138228.1 ATP-grasp domain-containing protein [Planctomycetota bacterium]